jgi:RNA recognition motif-containing protein
MSRVFIGRLDRDVRERDVEKLVSRYGEVRDVLMKSGFCFVVCLFVPLNEAQTSCRSSATSAMLKIV